MLQDAHLVRRLRYRSLGGVLIEGEWGLLQMVTKIQMGTMVSRNSISFLRPKSSSLTSVCSNLYWGWFISKSSLSYSLCLNLVRLKTFWSSYYEEFSVYPLIPTLLLYLTASLDVCYPLPLTELKRTCFLTSMNLTSSVCMYAPAPASEDTYHAYFL